jgi:flagella basal body P-ring formation protein FlgA
MLLRVIVLATFGLGPTFVWGETLVATHTIRAQTILAPSDVTIVNDTVPGAFTHPLDVVGLEARVVLYTGRPIRPGDVGPAAIIDRNQIVTLLFSRNGLKIATEARALGRAGVGDRVRVMNLASRSTITGTVDRHGRVLVGPSSALLEDMERN